MIEEHEEQLANAFRSFTRLERTLRQVVGEALNAYFGMEWDKQIPTTVRENCEAKMQEALKSDLGPEREKNLLTFADFSQLTIIVEYLWEKIFYRWFLEKQFTMGRFEEIRLYRNALMHSVLLPKECPIFISLCQSFIEQLEVGPRETDTVLLIEEKLEDVAYPPQITHLPTTESQSAFYQKVMTVLNEMTGSFEGERDALLEHLDRHLSLCSPVLLEQVRHKFINLPETNSKLQTLASRLPPKKPELPNPKDWKDTKKCFKWAVGSYLPYRYWMITNNQVDDEIEAMSQIYEEWLYNSYPKLLNRPQQFVYGTYQDIVQLLERQTVLWVMIDNLPFFFRATLARHLKENGFRIEKIIRQLSMLPSETTISRKSALIGCLPNQIPEDANEADALLEAWQNRTNQTHILGKLNDFENIDQYQANLFIYIYNWLDKLGHTPSSKDFEREAEIDTALARLISKLRIAMTQLTQIGPATLVISTDHGSTYLPHRGQGLSVPLAAMEDATYQEHRRFIRTSRRDVLNDTEWFYLDKDKFCLHHNYAVARGWRYIGSRPRGYTHGGLSPEETIVPMFICELGKGESELLQLYFEHATDFLRLGRPGKLAIRVRNPYRIPIESLEITLSDFGQTFPPVDVDPQMEAITDALEFTLPPKMTVEEEAVFINITALFTARDQPHSQMTKLRIKVRQLFKTELDDEFGAMF